ncbi:MAG: SBBP repeat-containing protein [bacterium]
MLRAQIVIAILVTSLALLADLPARGGGIEGQASYMPEEDNPKFNSAMPFSLQFGWNRPIPYFSGTRDIESVLWQGSSKHYLDESQTDQDNLFDLGDAPLVLWTRHHASGINPPYNQAYAIAVDESGNVYVTGFRTKEGCGKDCCTIKRSASGSLIWEATFDGGTAPTLGTSADNDDWAMAIAVDDFGNVYITGSSYNTETGFDFITIKYDRHGLEEWFRRYNGPGNGDDYAYDLRLDESGNVYVVGVSWGGPGFSGGTDYDYAVVKYDSNGDSVWEFRYDREDGWDEATAIALDQSGNVYITGWSWSWETSWDYTTIKLGADGIQQWISHYNGCSNGWDFARDIAVDSQGNTYVTGSSECEGTGFDYATIKYDSDGNQVWVARYDGQGNGDDHAIVMDLDRFGNPHVTGWTEGRGTGTDYTTIKYDAEGGQLWIAHHSGPGNGNDHAFDIAVDDDGNVFVTGEILVPRYSLPQGFGYDYDFCTVKYNAIGEIQWAPGYDKGNGSNDCASAIAVDNSGNIYVTGWSAFNSACFYTTIKYYDSDVLPGDMDVAASVTDKIDSTQISIEAHPNPAFKQARIMLLLPTAGLVRVIIYDAQGREIARVIEEERDAGLNSIRWDAKGIPSGIYFLMLEFGSQVKSEKIVLLK